MKWWELVSLQDTQAIALLAIVVLLVVLDVCWTRYLAKRDSSGRHVSSQTWSGADPQTTRTPTQPLYRIAELTSRRSFVANDQISLWASGTSRWSGSLVSEEYNFDVGVYIRLHGESSLPQHTRLLSCANDLFCGPLHEEISRKLHEKAVSPSTGTGRTSTGGHT